MVRQRDPFWEYAERLNGRFICKFCNKDFSGGVPRIKSHLSGIRGRDIEICTQVPEEVQTKAFLAIEGSNKKSKIGESSNSSTTTNLDKISTSSSSLPKNLHQATIPSICKIKDKAAVDKLLTKFIIMNNIAFNVVQTSSFKELVAGISDYGAGYKPPSYSTLRTKLIPQAKDDVDKYVANVKKSWAKTGCTLMSDIWSDMKQRAFINFVAYSPGGAVFLKSFDISSEKKTGLYLRDILSSVIDEIGPENVVQFVSDNASNFESAGDMIMGKYPHLYKTRCAAHGIQLLLKDIYDEVGWVRNIIDDAKSIVSYMYKHTIVLSLMREHTNGKELKHPCVTRFASNFQMLQSILEVENELRLLVASPTWRSLDYSKHNVAIKVTQLIQNNEWWNKAKEVLQTLEPLVRVLRLVDGEGSTSGYLYEAMTRAKEAIKQRCGNNESKYKKILELFEVRKKKNIIHPVHAAAAFLNPAYMCSENFNEDREMKEGINFMFRNLVAPEERQLFLAEVQKYRIKVSTLFTDAAVAMLKTSHPRVWWDYCGDSLPILQKYAIRVLSQPCSSSSCERNWSAFEAAQTKKRNKLAPEMLENLVYVRMNTMMMEKFSSLEANDLEPIDLENLGELPEYFDPEQNEDGYPLGEPDMLQEQEDGDISWLEASFNS